MNQDMFLDRGNLSNKPGKHDYEFPSSSDLFSLPANLITGLSGTSGGRVLLGSKATLQAISLTKRQVPLVQSVANHGDISFVEKVGKNLLSVQSKVAGVVTEVTEDEILVKPEKGAAVVYELYNNFNYGRKTGMHSIPAVKVGDKVKVGTILATSNYTDSEGNMALGTNLNVAVMPYRSNNFEDAYMVSETGAKKLEAEQLMQYRLEEKMGVEITKNKYVSLFPNKFLNNQLANIDADGVIKKGSIVNHNDPLILAIAPKTLKATDVQLGRLSKVLRNFYRDSAETWDYEHPGTVVDVSKSQGLVTVNVKTIRPVGIGDKISIPFGAKGVISRIISDTEVPQTKDGMPVDVVLNSMSITSRVAPALAITMALGKIAQKTGKTVTMPHFINTPRVTDAINELAKHGLSDTEELYDPVTGQHVNVLTGPLYFSRLSHISEDKISSRSQGTGYSADMQPTKSKDSSAKKIGNLSTTALLSHGATAVLRDIGTIKSSKNDEFWRRLQLGQPVPSPEVPFIFNKFIASLQGAGVNVTKKGDTFHVLPLTDKDTLKLSNGPIHSPTTYKLKGGTLIHETGGMFDPAKTGILGDKFNHMDLHMSVPNPISETYLRKLLEVTQDKFNDLVIKGELAKQLEAIDIDAKIKQYRQYLKTGKKTKRDDAASVLTFLQTLKNNNLHPKDLMLTKVPIIPAQYRPIMAQGDRQIISDVNHLYKELMMNNNSLKDTTGVPDHIKDKLKSFQYQGVKAVFGLGEPITVKSQEKGIRGLLSSTLGIKGGSAKTTMFQSRVVNKPVELVGRAVLIPDAKLDLDQASVPQELLWTAYAPFIIKRLVQRGVPATKASEYLKNKNSLAQQALMEELQHRPGIISREPALHKFNLLGFHLKPNPDSKDTTIKLNPLVFKGMGADCDGDQVNVNVPATDEAVAEIKVKMMPSNSLLSPKNFRASFVPSNEAALGIYTSNTKDNKNTPKKYKTESDVIKDFNASKLHVGDRVEIG